MRWATRAGCHVDRAACAWRIRRFVDHDATFCFVDDPDGVPPDVTRFDLRGVELSHHDGDCRDLDRIVHEADLADERFDAPEDRSSTRCVEACRWFSVMTSSWVMAGSSP